MAGLTQTEQQATLDARFPTAAATDYIAYSANGTSETASLARTAIGATGWAAATAATPSVKANNAILTTVSGTVTIAIPFTPTRLTLTGHPWTPTLTGHAYTPDAQGSTDPTPVLAGRAWTPTLTGTAHTPTLTGVPS